MASSLQQQYKLNGWSLLVIGMVLGALAAFLYLRAGATTARQACRDGGGVVDGSGFCKGGKLNGVCVGGGCAYDARQKLNVG